MNVSNSKDVLSLINIESELIKNLQEEYDDFDIEDDEKLNERVIKALKYMNNEIKIDEITEQEVLYLLSTPLEYKYYLEKDKDAPTNCWMKENSIGNFKLMLKYVSNKNNSYFYIKNLKELIKTFGNDIIVYVSKYYFDGKINLQLLNPFQSVISLIYNILI